MRAAPPWVERQEAANGRASYPGRPTWFAEDVANLKRVFGVVDDDPAVALKINHRRQAIQTREQKLALEMLALAIDDAETGGGHIKGTLKEENKADARAWLLDVTKLYSGGLCCEGIGIDYDAMLAKLEAKWAALA